MDKIAAGLAISKFLDLTVTEYGIHNNYIREANPLMKDRPTRIIVNSAMIAAGPVIYTQIKKSHPKVAKVVGIIVIAGNGYLVYHNLRLMKK